MTDVLAPWDTFFAGNYDQFFRANVGSCLVMDYTGTVNWNAWTPFSTSPNNGEIATAFYQNGAFRDGWFDLGYGDKTGLKFSETVTAASSSAWQGQRDANTSFSKVATKGVFTAQQITPYIDALRKNLPLASVPALGAAGYQLVTPRYTYPIYRTVAFMSMKLGRLGRPWMKWDLYPMCLMKTPGDKERNNEKDEMAVLTFEPEDDPVSGTAYIELQDGPGWRDLGGTPGVPGTPTAAATGSGGVTLSFTAATGVLAGTTYVAFRSSAPSTPVTPASIGGTQANPILTLSGQATGTCTYTVQAVGPNLATSAQSTASNSVTVT